MQTVGKYYYNDEEMEQEAFLNTIKDGKYQDKDGTVFFRKNYVLHKEDGPAIVYPYGQKEWWNGGVLHRNPQEGPAIVFPNGNGDYWVHGKRLHAWKQRWLNSALKRFVLWLMRVGIIVLLTMVTGCKHKYLNMKLSNGNSVLCKQITSHGCGDTLSGCVDKHRYECQTNYEVIEEDSRNVD